MIRSTLQENLTLEISNKLSLVLGFPHRNQVYHKMLLPRGISQIGGNSKINTALFTPPYLTAHLNIIHPTLHSGEYANILKIVPVRRNDSATEGYQLHEFKKLNIEKYQIHL